MKNTTFEWRSAERQFYPEKELKKQLGKVRVREAKSGVKIGELNNKET